jgi:urease subunit alpha
MATKISRAVYADLFGPTGGERVADSDIITEAGKNFCSRGEEAQFGGGKLVRDGVGCC